ncbi:MAG: esterase family protein [Clostridia bacterium]|nr:esterase family protein [Clostridia bacterium]
MALVQTYFFSQSLGMCVSCNVILPQREAEKDTGTPERYPTLWLLHGMSDDETIWERRTSIERYAGAYGLAVVMPCVHLSSYADMAHGGNYYTYIAKELPLTMRSFFPLSDRREDNFIAGLSMGGAGAMKIGLANPLSYAAIGCLSAGGINGIGSQPTDKSRRRSEMLYGSKDLKGTEEDVFGSAQKALADGMPLPHIYHSCGTEDFILPSALNTKEFFEAIPGNPFEYVYESDPGKHTWEYWDEHIQKFLKYLGLEKKYGFC